MNRLITGRKHNNPYTYSTSLPGYSSTNELNVSLNKIVFKIPGKIYKSISQIIILNNQYYMLLLYFYYL